MKMASYFLYYPDSFLVDVAIHFRITAFAFLLILHISLFFAFFIGLSKYNHCCFSSVYSNLFSKHGSNLLYRLGNFKRLFAHFTVQCYSSIYFLSNPIPLYTLLFTFCVSPDSTVFAWFAQFFAFFVYR